MQRPRPPGEAIILEGPKTLDKGHVCAICFQGSQQIHKALRRNVVEIRENYRQVRAELKSHHFAVQLPPSLHGCLEIALIRSIHKIRWTEQHCIQKNTYPYKWKHSQDRHRRRTGREVARHLVVLKPLEGAVGQQGHKDEELHDEKHDGRGGGWSLFDVFLREDSDLLTVCAVPTFLYNLPGPVSKSGGGRELLLSFTKDVCHHRESVISLTAMKASSSFSSWKVTPRGRPFVGQQTGKKYFCLWPCLCPRRKRSRGCRN